MGVKISHEYRESPDWPWFAAVPGIVGVGLLLLLGFFMCTPPATVTKASNRVVRYIKDDRTNLCWAIVCPNPNINDWSQMFPVDCEKLAKLSPTEVEQSSKPEAK